MAAVSLFIWAYFQFNFVEIKQFLQHNGCVVFVWLYSRWQCWRSSFSDDIYVMNNVSKQSTAQRFWYEVTTLLPYTININQQKNDSLATSQRRFKGLTSKELVKKILLTRFKGDLQGKNKLVSSIRYKFQELVFAIIFGEQGLEMEMFCPIHKQNWNWIPSFVKLTDSADSGQRNLN